MTFGCFFGGFGFGILCAVLAVAIVQRPRH